MGKDKKKKKSAEHKQRLAEKLDRKAQKQERKRRGQGGFADDSDDDIDLILAQFKAKQAEEKAVTQVESSPPSPRTNATLTTNPLNASELIFFGGEAFNGQVVEFYNELYVFNTESEDWTLVTSPTSPGPRSSHQAVAMPNGYIYFFGGEFANRSETRFLHWRDFWRFNVKDRSWEDLTAQVKQLPNPRSGHRMTAWKHFIVLFGGFYDAGASTKYYDDTWIFDTKSMRWHRIEPNLLTSRPSARSGFQLFTSATGVYLYGGYSKIFTKGQKAKGTIHTDCWFLSLNVDLDQKQIVWSKVKKAGVPPSARAGISAIVHKDRSIFFGGVEDIEIEDDLKSVAKNDLFMFNMDQKKFYAMALRRKKTPGLSSNSDEAPSVPQPCPRFSTCLAVAKNALYMYGGVCIHEANEHTLGDLWVLRLDKLDEWKCLLDLGQVEWLSDDEDDDDSDNDLSDGDSDEDDDGAYGDSDCDSDFGDDDDGQSEKNGGAVGNCAVDSVIDAAAQASQIAPEAVHVDSPIVTGQNEDGDSSQPMPLRKETLKDFYSRTSAKWLAQAHAQAAPEEQANPKHMKRAAFSLAQSFFEECHANAPSDMDSDDSDIEQELTVKQGTGSHPTQAISRSRR
ncbi:hypothetical protein BCR44DRAFT_138340 [Catenaria anguillulae PL171]|uniref:DUF4110 domain-containing protein n=1 Tax=Catenaria anguillulae PL171 TaxID=765915 RepID=A0A1Y2HKC4_9FUNG|nr:hypothetical protein BCR44DRAFT_138340 [Catenaria anguillulae PL171]